MSRLVTCPRCRPCTQTQMSRPIDVCITELTLNLLRLLQCSNASSSVTRTSTDLQI